MKESAYIDLFLKNNGRVIERIAHWKRYRWIMLLNRKVRKLYPEYLKETDPVKKNELCAQALNSCDNMWIKKARIHLRLLAEDIRVFFKQFGKRTTIDRSDKRSRDYYSVATITKNSARYIREFILFYKATGADRVYLYDNDSTDGLTDVIRPFVESGFVVYRRWPGRGVQTAADRDAVRRSKRRTKWLAIMDDDEFLFSPKGPMPEQLRDYEDYPGIGANWVMFGPNGHDKSPEGLVMDNYTTTFEDGDCIGNHHIKSIVPVFITRITRSTNADSMRSMRKSNRLITSVRSWKKPGGHLHRKIIVTFSGSIITVPNRWKICGEKASEVMQTARPTQILMPWWMLSMRPWSSIQ